ncbi:MAG: ring-1,2-phenylacetyl-CoA epoxidase subunit PaaC [Maribacter sp.]|jgi:ring-1,2-phenylacetyl-CoA epoxidase subunit PaaC
MNLFNYILQLGDNSLVLGHRLSEICGHGPILEVDMALTNISLDLIGQARNYYQYAAEIEGKGRTEDDMAMLRDVREFKNALLLEQPNEDFAYTIARQFFFDAFHQLFLEELQQSKDERLAAIAVKSSKEVKYHFRYSSEWMKRLGDGTEESHNKLQTAVDDLWMYVGELCEESEVDKQAVLDETGVDLNKVRDAFYENIDNILTQSTITRPESKWNQSGGKTGNHTEHMGFILSELQWMQKTYPNMEW